MKTFYEQLNEKHGSAKEYIEKEFQVKVTEFEVILEHNPDHYHVGVYAYYQANGEPDCEYDEELTKWFDHYVDALSYYLALNAYLGKDIAVTLGMKDNITQKSKTELA